jgi:predicted outer membrane repeat protein
MQFAQYQALALKTESVPTALSMNPIALHAILEMSVAMTKVADLVKRKFFYGKDIDPQAMLAQVGFINNLSAYLGGALQGGEDINVPLTAEQIQQAGLPPNLQVIDLSNINIRLLHSVIGTFTESGEKLEALKAQYEGNGLDVVNMAEEFGDDNWYDATGKDELTKLAAVMGLTITDASIRLGNITKLQGNAKLAGRYNAGDFDAVAALNRNLTNERAVLEAAVVKPAVAVC